MKAERIAAHRAKMARKAARRAQGDRSSQPNWHKAKRLNRHGKPHKHLREIERRLRQLPLVREGAR